MAAPAWATQANAQEYYNSLTPAQRQGVPMDNLVEWYINAVNAGVPDAVRIAGGKKGSGEAGWEVEGGYTLDLTGASAGDPSEWLGKRKPSPTELRRYAREAGWSEDFNRYTDRQLGAWINDSWDVTGNKFRNPGGDLVEKPTEETANWQGVTKGAGGGGGAAPKAPAAAASPAAMDPLQQRLLEMFAGGEGQFATNRAVGQNLEGGGLWWSGTDDIADDKPGAENAAAAGGRPGSRGGQQSFSAPTTGAVSPALAQAMMTAFTPQAPSATGAGTAPPATGAPTSVPTGPGQMPTFPTTPPAPTQGAQPWRPASPAGGGSELTTAISRRYGPTPAKWWESSTGARTA